ncbi:MAG TPA: hypothetical protein DEA08_23855 [Planctomycetes bacterium]|nr:hypothetical protein [Planctomycetota bacterium]
MTYGVDGTLALWAADQDSAPRDRIMVLPDQRIRRVVEGKRGELYVIAGQTGLWRLAAGEHTHLVPRLLDVQGLALSSERVIYAATEGGGVVRYDLRAQRELEPWGSPDQVYHGVAARAGLVYVLGGQSGFLEVYEEGAERRAPRERVALAAVPRSLVLEPGGAWAAIGTYTGEIRRLDLKTKTFLPPFMAPDVRTAHQGVVARNELAHHSSVRAMVFARDGALLSSSMGDQREINELRIWDPESRQERRPVFKPNLRLSESLAVSADGREVALGTKEGEVLVLRR